jgi:hypothetical protein
MPPPPLIPFWLDSYLQASETETMLKTTVAMANVAPPFQ